MKRKLAFLLALCLLAAFFFGCARQPQNTNQLSGTAQTSSSAVKMPQLKEAKALLKEADYDNVQRIAQAMDAFSFALTEKLSKDGENLVVSPMSVWITLAALCNAIDDPATLAACQKALYIDGMDMADVNAGVSHILYRMTHTTTDDGQEYNPLSIANAVFADDEVTLDADFAQTALDYFRAYVMSVDFSDPSAAEAVNKWASEQTNGLIENVVDGFDPMTVLAFANAVYFSDRFSNEFDPEATEKGVFHGAANDQDAMLMRRENTLQPYFEDESLQALTLPMVCGSGLIILLPKDGDASALLSSMTAKRFSEIRDNMTPCEGTFVLPRFTADYSASLAQTLKGMGLSEMFREGSLSSLVNETDAQLSETLHKATIAVDEKGTTAAAVTVSIVTATGMIMPGEPFEMICDRPFAFVLYSRGQVIFAGTINNL